MAPPRARAAGTGNTGHVTWSGTGSVVVALLLLLPVVSNVPLEGSTSIVDNLGSVPIPVSIPIQIPILFPILSLILNRFSFQFTFDSHSDYSLGS